VSAARRWIRFEPRRHWSIAAAQFLEHVANVTAISLEELHARTAHWVRQATAEEPIVLTDNGEPVARIVPKPAPKPSRPFAARKLLPQYEAIMHHRFGGKDSTEIVSEMRDGQ
jgi:prevent-host-death family protein